MEKRTKRKNFLSSFLAILVMAVMLIGSMAQAVFADDYVAGKTGNINLTIQETGEDGTVKPIPNVNLTLYKVGSVTFDRNVHFVVDSALQFTGIDFENLKTADEWYKTADTLSAAVKKAGLSGSEMQSDANGKIVYSNMAEGVYLIVQSNPDDPNVSVSPMVLTVPFVEEGTGWTYDVQAYPKAVTRDGDKETKIQVTKRLYYINQDTFDVIEMEADDATYKVGLFLDDKGTIPFRSDYMKDIRLVKASSGTATWANVPDGKYYVFELDENGDPMTINDSIIIDEGKSYYYDVTDSNENATNEAEISQNGSTESVSYVNNYYSFIPTGFALKGHITINKKVLVDGQKTTVPDTFYAAVFETGADDSLNLVEGTIRELWNDHIRLVYTDRIPDSKFQLFHNADIMHTGPAYRRAFQFYRFKNSYRIDQACSGRAPLNFQKFRITHLICPFKCHGISGKFSCSSKRFSIGNIVIQSHQSI